MAESSKIPVKTDKSPMPALQSWRPFENLRREIDRLFDDFDGGFWRSPFRGPMFDLAPFRYGEGASAAIPAVDVAETDQAYEIAADMPGMDEKSIEVKVSDGVLSIRGEKREEKEEKTKDYHLHERSFGSFQRAFQLPDSVDPDRIEAKFKGGVLKLTLPKNAEAQKAAKKIEVKAA